MNLFDFEIDEHRIGNNIIEFENMGKSFLFRNNENLFDMIDIDDARLFLEPALFYYFLYAEALGEKDISLMQILWGYIADDKKPAVISVRSDANGLIHIPDFGDFKYTPGSGLDLAWDQKNGRYAFMADSRVAPLEPLTLSSLGNSAIKLCQHIPYLLSKNGNETNFLEPIPETLNRFLPVINAAWSIMNDILPGLCSLIERTTREICIFSSDNQHSKASIGYFGTAFLNVRGENHDEVFFIDDIAHQCGHVLFYALTFPGNAFFKAHPRTPIRTFTHVDWEQRDIYGCFHGLFTYSTILFSLKACMDRQIFEGKQRHELMGRFAFYMNKFRKDLAVMNDPMILNEKGFEYFDMFKSGYDKLLARYKTMIRKIDFSNQSYLFNYELFEKLNAPDAVYAL